MITETLHYILILIGVFFLYTAIFIYEDGNKRVQNKLVDIYLDIQIIKEKYSTIRALMIKANEIILIFFKRYFDDGKLTFNSIGISGLLYICFGYYVIALINPHLHGRLYERIYSQPQYLLYCTVPIVIIFLSYKKLNTKYPIYFSIVCIVLLGIIIAGLIGEGFYSILEMPIPFMISIFCIKLNISVTKWNIKNLVGKKSYLLIIPSLVINIICVCGIMYGTFLLIDRMDPTFLAGAVVLVSFFPAFLIITITNSAFILLFLAIVANKIIFPIVSEPIRALYEHNLIKNKKTLASIGFLFLLIASPQFMDNPVIKTVEGFFK